MSGAEAALVPPAEAPDAPTSAPRGRARARVGAVAVAAGTLAWPWLGSENGLDRGGAPLALALLCAWGTSATALLARTRRGLALGEAATDAAAAALLTALVALRHPWLPGSDLRPTWVPIFGPLALLALLDLVVRLSRRGGGEVTAIRVAAATVAAGAFVVAWQPLPAAAAAWLAAGPAAVNLPRAARSARRGVEALALLACLGLLLARPWNESLVGVVDAGETPSAWVYLFGLASAGAGLASLRGLFAPEGGSTVAA